MYLEIQERKRVKKRCGIFSFRKGYRWAESGKRYRHKCQIGDMWIGDRYYTLDDAKAAKGACMKDFKANFDYGRPAPIDSFLFIFGCCQK